MKIAKCKALKGVDRDNLASQIANFLNTLEEEVRLNAKVEVAVINTNGDFYRHFAYIIYFVDE